MASPRIAARPDAGAARSFVSALGLLVLTGSLLALSIILSGVAAAQGAPMLSFLVAVMGGAGLCLLMLARALGQMPGRGRWPPLLAYGAGAGAFMALPNAMGYLAVAHVGAGYLSLTFAFPLLLTYLMALAVGMDRFRPARLAGVAAALAGGVLLALSKFGQDGPAAAGAGWIALASAVPLFIALGNLYRTRFWPAGAQPVLLAGLMLVLAAVLVLPLAIAREGAGAALLWRDPGLRLLVTLNIALFCIQYVAYFRLQHVAGPVYLSQLGSVAALVGAGIAAAMGEALPPAAPLSALFFGVGLVLFHRAADA
ncbi:MULTISPECIES: DMT family transporter [Actibacterium]|uniref:Drug/metabolite transporter (DMT)-like permease n=1 Tax=Actibacterium naphthalenivorans TaxID=1614693 RepID=A0A840CFZ8_9RHOB|nr:MULTISPECIES: DMT family transporter [Actibacterium]ALG90755.1 hypothetical protein TQ29_11865 [Actibacterium sp. EMB200-NS6]MBB4023032.1 drug/metabolite transporter (DMT)-like permease [Actibacterium naphthalenivorans]